MNVVKCPVCGNEMKRNGKTSAGKTRWRCKTCGSSTIEHINNAAKRLDGFLNWLLFKQPQKNMAGQGRTFRRKTSEFWHIWPLPPITGEIHRVVFVDGIYLSRKICVLIARSEEYVLGWYVSKSECCSAYKALMARIAPPEVVVSDGGSGFQKARRQIWSSTRVQRCTFHAFSQVKRYTTTRPRTQAGVDLYALAKQLLKIQDSEQAAVWIAEYAHWCSTYDEFLKEQTINDEGRAYLTHERLVKARNSLSSLIKQGTLFTYVDPDLTTRLGAIPATNNAVESTNAQLRSMLREHRGLTLDKRIKAVYWWCYMHTENPLPAAEILRVMPTDADIAKEMRNISYENRTKIGPQRWGDGLVWEELHPSTPWRRDWD